MLRFLIPTFILGALLGMLACTNITLEPTCPSEFAEIEYNGQQICVMRDYYSVNDVREPLTYNDAMQLAVENGWQLPTEDLVDYIWQIADCRLEPIPMTPDAGMTTPARFAEHDALIDQQLEGLDCQIVAGHKKDVLSNGNIYGWHRLNGTPIQPQTGIHGNNYRDYSHGIRFVFTL